MHNLSGTSHLNAILFSWPVCKKGQRPSDLCSRMVKNYLLHIPGKLTNQQVHTLCFRPQIKYETDMENPEANEEALSHLRKKKRQQTQTNRNIYFLYQQERLAGHTIVPPSPSLRQTQTKLLKSRGRIELVKVRNGFQNSVTPEYGANSALIRGIK